MLNNLICYQDSDMEILSGFIWNEGKELHIVWQCLGPTSCRPPLESSPYTTINKTGSILLINNIERLDKTQ